MNLESGECLNQSRLESRMHAIWDDIDQVIIDNLFNSLPERMKKVIASGGQPINC